MQKPKYVPTLSLGNVLTLVGGMFVAATVWVAIEVGITEAKAATIQNQSTIKELEGRVSRLEQRTEKRLDSIDGKLDELIKRK